MMESMFPDWQDLTEAQHQRWETVLGMLTGALPARAAGVVVEGEHAAHVADRLARALRSAGRPCIRLTSRSPAADEDARRAERAADTVVVADGTHWREHPPAGRWDLAVRLRAPGGPARDEERQGPGPAARIVVDLADPHWPVVRAVTGRAGVTEHWYVAENRAFFAVRAATWDTRFGDDMPAYAAAIAEAGPPAGGTALDLGCGTGRALPALRAAVGSTGRVIGLDVTPQMLDAVRAAGRDLTATGLLLADAHRLPFADASVDLIFAAGLINHLNDARGGLSELARVTRADGHLVLFHPTGRAALAARHGRALRPDEPLAEHVLARGLAAGGWKLTRYDDAEHRFFAIAARVA